MHDFLSVMVLAHEYVLLMNLPHVFRILILTHFWCEILVGEGFEHWRGWSHQRATVNHFLIFSCLRSLAGFMGVHRAALSLCHLTSTPAPPFLVLARAFPHERPKPQRHYQTSRDKNGICVLACISKYALPKTWGPVPMWPALVVENRMY